MNKSGVCALCKNENELMESHIIPKFVYRFLKKDSFTGRMRSLSNPDIPLQDGDKQYLLCGECEKLFNVKETLFSNKIYFPFKKNGFEKLSYDGNWLNYFITSVNWRSLYLDIIGFEENNDPENSITEKQLKLLKKNEQIMREYLLGKRRDIDSIENHIFFFDTIESIGGVGEETSWHSLVQGSAFGYTTLTKNDGIYVFTNLTGAIIVTIIKKEQKEKWKNTFVKNEAGKFKSPQYTSSSVFAELRYVAKQRKRSMELMSEKQKQQLINKIEKSPEKFMKSGSYKRFIKDKQIKSTTDIN